MTLKQYLQSQLKDVEHREILCLNQATMDYEWRKSLLEERKMIEGFIRDIESGEVKVTSAGLTVDAQGPSYSQPFAGSLKKTEYL